MKCFYYCFLTFHLAIFAFACTESASFTQSENSVLNDTLYAFYDTSKNKVTSRAIDSFIATILNNRKDKTNGGMQITIWEPVITKVIFIDFSNNKPSFKFIKFRLIGNSPQSKIFVENIISVQKPKSGWKLFLDSLGKIQLSYLEDDFPYYKFGQLTHGTWVDIEKSNKEGTHFGRALSPSFYKNVIFSCYQVSNLLNYIQVESGIEIEDITNIEPSDPSYYGVDSLYRTKLSQIFIDSLESLDLNQACPIISEYPEKIFLNSAAEVSIENRLQNPIEFYIAVDKSAGKEWHSSYLSVNGFYPFDSNVIGVLEPGQKVSKKLFEPGGRCENRASHYFHKFITQARFVVYYREKGSLKFKGCRTKAIPVIQYSN